MFPRLRGNLSVVRLGRHFVYTKPLAELSEQRLKARHLPRVVVSIVAHDRLEMQMTPSRRNYIL